MLSSHGIFDYAAGYTMDEVAKLAKKCILLGNEKRPELEWVRKSGEDKKGQNISNF